MKRLIIGILVLTSCISHAQNFEEHIKKGGQLYSGNDFEKSAKEYEKAFLLNEGNSSQYYNAACSWALTGDTLKSIEFLNLSAEKGWKNLKHLKKDSDLSTLHGVYGWDEILKVVQINLDEYEKDFNKPLKNQLEKIYVRDQTLRQLYEEAEEKFGSDSDEMNYYWQVVSEQDSLNELETESIIEKHGWVGKSIVGGQANMTLWLVIQHAALETQEKYLPLLRESVMEGESSGSHLALLEDRIQMRNGEPQTYGSQITMDNESGEQMIYDIKDPEYVNQRRAKVGLDPLEEYVKRWGLTWTVEQKEK